MTRHGRRPAGLARALGPGLLAVLLGAAPGPGHAAGVDYAAYGRLLEAHVRPGTIDGIALHTVDYAAVKADPALPQALRDFAAARPEAFGSEADRIAFWVNAYNLLAIKAVVDRYPLRSLRDASGLFRRIWDTKLAAVAGEKRTLDEIEHEILRKRFREPRIHFAIVCASLSCPDLRPEPYEGARLAAQLEDATRRFLLNPGKGVAPGADGRTARVSSIFKWFAEDFGGGPAAIVEFLKAHAGPDLGPRLAGLTAPGLSYLEYDWSLNDAARSR